MNLDINQPDLTVGIIGAGAMGRGIAQIAALAGIRVLLHDASAGATENALASVATVLARSAEKGKISPDTADAAIKRITPATALADLAPCHVVIEAIVENLEIKRKLFRDLEAIVGAGCILATNTSSLSVTGIAAGCDSPARFAGYHFFNPVPLMKVVEVIDGLLTDAWVGDALCALALRMGHTPVRAQDAPGFIVNHAGRGYGTEALRVLGEGIAEFHEVDAILRESAGFRMGPFELLDLTGLDVSHPVMESIYDQFYQEPRFRPSRITAQRLAAGVLGRKTQRGFYFYDNGTQRSIPDAPPPAARPGAVWLSRENPAAHALLTELLGKLGASVDTAKNPGPDSLCVVTPLGHDATTSALAQGLDPARTVAIDTLFPLERRRTVMTTPLTAPAMRAAAHGIFAADGVPVTMIRDSAGFVAQRVVAMIVNVGCDIVQQRICSPKDLDLAVSLGLGYPKGPLSLGDALGPMNILGILENMLSFYGDPRYRPSPWLVRRARLGASLLTPE